MYNRTHSESLRKLAVIYGVCMRFWSVNICHHHCVTCTMVTCTCNTNGYMYHYMYHNKMVTCTFDTHGYMYYYDAM